MAESDFTTVRVTKIDKARLQGLEDYPNEPDHAIVKRLLDEHDKVARK
jgi:hypothetical protein